MHISARHLVASLLALNAAAAPIYEATRAIEDIVISPDPYRALVQAGTLTKRDVHFRKAIEKDFADPSLFHDSNGNSWWAFASNNHRNVAVHGGRLINVQIARSPDFEQWTLLAGQDALPVLPVWVNAASPRVWAPKIIRNDHGQYVLYFSAIAKDSHGKHCVGTATASTPQGPYTAAATPFVCPLAQGGAIDASGFRDADGSLYVVYKVDGNSNGQGGSCGNTNIPIHSTPIMLQRVDTDGITPLGKPMQILDRDAGDGPLVEAPSLMHVPENQGGGYVLFYSSNCFSSSHYNTAYAFAKNIQGPYTKKGVLAQTGTQGLFSPGGADVAHDGQHFVLHAGNAGPATGVRALYVGQIAVDARQQTVTA